MTIDNALSDCKTAKALQEAAKLADALSRMVSIAARDMNEVDLKRLENIPGAQWLDHGLGQELRALSTLIIERVRVNA